MKQITQEKFLEMVKKDKGMAERLAKYLGGETDTKVVGKKTAEFAKKEGYEFTLSGDDLANVSGGAVGFEDVSKYVQLGLGALTALTQTGLGIAGAVMGNKKD